MHTSIESNNDIFYFLSIEKCSHSKSHAYFLESLTAGVEFPAIHCVSYEEISRDECSVIDHEKKFLMGGDFTKDRARPMGIFYLETNEEPPFAIRNVYYFTKVKKTFFS